MPIPPSRLELFERGYFAGHFGVTLERLLIPLDPYNPAGEPARNTSAYRALTEARRSDDPSLPRGAWAMELRRADWRKVSVIAITILSEMSKDLQIAAWLLEAQIHERGYAAVAPGLALMQGLCETFGERLHPRTDDATFEATGNVVRWIDSKLLSTIALAPLIEDGEQVATWAMWVQAERFDRLRAAHRELSLEAADGPSLKELATMLTRPSDEALRARFAELETACRAIQSFEDGLRTLADDMPSLSRLRELFERIRSTLREELDRRGLPVAEAVDAPAVVSSTGDASGEGDAQSVVLLQESVGAAPIDTVTERERAYRMLEEIAGTLARIEPHSLVPYLLRRAVRWGGMNSAELYREVVIEGGGRIDVVDVLGIEDAAGDAPS